MDLVGLLRSFVFVLIYTFVVELHQIAGKNRATATLCSCRVIFCMFILCVFTLYVHSLCVHSLRLCLFFFAREARPQRILYVN